MLFSNRYRNSAVYPLDLYNKEGIIMSLTKLQEKYHIKTNYLEYQRVKLNIETYVGSNVLMILGFFEQLKSSKLLKW